MFPLISRDIGDKDSETPEEKRERERDMSTFNLQDKGYFPPLIQRDIGDKESETLEEKRERERDISTFNLQCKGFFPL